jgi:hypothetical protein
MASNPTLRETSSQAEDVKPGKIFFVLREIS